MFEYPLDEEAGRMATRNDAIIRELLGHNEQIYEQRGTVATEVLEFLYGKATSDLAFIFAEQSLYRLIKTSVLTDDETTTLIQLFKDVVPYVYSQDRSAAIDEDHQTFTRFLINERQKPTTVLDKKRLEAIAACLEFLDEHSGQSLLMPLYFSERPGFERRGRPPAPEPGKE